MVHRSGSTLILAPNDTDRKQIFKNNHDGPNESQIFTDSQNLPQFLDGLDPCAESTVIQQKRKSSGLPPPSSNNTTEVSIVSSTPKPSRSFSAAQTTNRKSRKSLTTTLIEKTTTTTTAKFSNRFVNNETQKNIEEIQNDTKRISSPFRIRAGLRSNSLESNIYVRPNEDGTITTLVTPPRRRGRKIKKKHKNDDDDELKKCKSFDSIYDNTGGQIEDIITTEDTPTKLTCSLPLERLSSFLDTILSSTSGSTTLSDSKLTLITTEEESSPNSASVNNDSTTTTTSTNLGHSSHLTKSLCLYCDKKFSSHKVRIKHTERVHAISKGRRASSRTLSSCPLNPSSSSASTLLSPSSATTTTTTSPFPGCSYCCYISNKLKTVTVSEDLNTLFHHLIDCHSDKYFACKLCAIRFPNPEDLESHIEGKHSIVATVSDSNKTSKTEFIKKTKSKSSTTVTDSSAFDDTMDTLKTPPAQPSLNNIDTVAINSSDKALSSLGDDASNDPESTPTKTRRQLKQAMENKPLPPPPPPPPLTTTTKPCQNLIRTDEPILSRLGVAQNRLPRGRKGIRNRRICNLETLKSEPAPSTVKTRGKVGRVVTSNIMDPMEPISRPPTNSRIEVLSCTFDEDFYENVSINVRKNLSCHLDGKLDGRPTSPSPLSPVPTVPAISSTVVKNPLTQDSEIHEATALATVTAFPTLLTAEQYGCDLGGTRKIKRPITKHSWKWKWDCVKKYKYVNEGGKIVKKIKLPIAGFRDLSKLDMWTQLTMRNKHEMVRKQSSELTGLAEVLGIGGTTREEKCQQISQLNTILDMRRLPQINLEQSEQTIIKIEMNNDDLKDCGTISNSLPKAGELTNRSHIQDLMQNNNEDFPKMLNLRRRTTLNLTVQNDVILSGEWARPRCYICYGCGAKFDKLKSLEEHKMFRHPYVYSTHYEIVGRELIEGDLYKHFYIPTRALNRHKEYRLKLAKLNDGGDGKIGFNENSTCGEESMDSVNSVTASYTTTGTNRSDCDTEGKTVCASTSSSVTASLEVEEESTIFKFHGHCTKCKRECNGLLDLYRHMLDCSGDYAWILAKKKKYRYFGVKRKRHSRHNLPLPRRKIIKETKADNNGNGGELGSAQKPKTYSSTPRPKPSDAESIRRMLENLPAKRACRQIIPNITKPRVRKIPQGILVKSKNIQKSNMGNNMANTTVTAITKRILRNHNKRIYNRRLRQVKAATTAAATSKNRISQVNNNKKKTNAKIYTTILNESSDDVQQQQEQEENKTEMISCPPPKEPNEDVEEENITIKKNDSSKNVVQAIGKKTKRFVKKITEKFQSNKKTFLNKKTRNNSDNAMAAIITTPKDIDIKEDNSDNMKLNDEEPKEETATASKRLNKNNKETENTNITKMKNETKTNNNKSKQLLRKLSFRKSQRKKDEKCEIESNISSITTTVELDTTRKSNSGNPEISENINFASTNLAIAAVEASHTCNGDQKILKKKKGFKKILNKFKEKSNKKITKETENKIHTADNVNDINDEGPLNFETEINDVSKIKVNNDSGVYCNDNGPVIMKNNEVQQDQEQQQQEENYLINKMMDNHTFNAIDLDIQPLNLSIQQQQPQILQVSPSTKKRSKKLNDCIAMLTGKLQEKLGKPFFESSDNLDSALSRQSSTTDVSTSQEPNNLSFSSLDLSGAMKNDSEIKALPADEPLGKKLPKRKAITRKIIKKSNGNSSSDVVSNEGTTTVCDITGDDHTIGGGGGSGGVILRPPILKVSSPKETINLPASNPHFEDDHLMNTNITNIDVDAKLNTTNKSDICNDIFPEKQKLYDNLKKVNHNKGENMSTSTTININSNDSLSNEDKHKTNINITAEDSLGLPKSKKKITRRGGKKKQQEISALENSKLSKSEKDENEASIEKTSSNLNLIEKDKLVSKDILIVSQEKNEASNAVVMKENPLKKKPGRKPKRSIIKTIESTAMNSSDSSNKTLEISTNHDNSEIIKTNNRTKKDSIKDTLDTPYSTKIEIICNGNEKLFSSLSSSSNRAASSAHQNKNVSFDLDSSGDERIDNKNSSSADKVCLTAKKARGRKPKIKAVANKNNSEFEMLHNYENETEKSKILINEEEEPLDLAVSNKQDSDEVKSLKMEKTKNESQKKKKNINKTILNTPYLEEMKETEISTADIDKNGTMNPIIPVVKKRGKGRKKNVTINESLQTFPKLTEITETKSKENEHQIQSKQSIDDGVTLKTETKKYTRKTKKSCDTKILTSDLFDTLKQIPDNAILYHSINLNDDDNQIPLTSSSENVTLQNTLPLSSSTNIIPSIERSEICKENNVKNKKNVKGSKSGCLKGKGKKQNQSNLEKITTAALLQETTDIQNIVAATKITTTTNTMKSIKSPKNSRKTEKKIQAQEKLSTAKKSRNNRDKMQQKSSGNLNSSLTEVEEIVASFLSDDDDADALAAAQIEQNSRDKPIRLDNAEAILTEHRDDDVEDVDGEDENIDLSNKEEKQNENVIDSSINNDSITKELTTSIEDTTLNLTNEQSTVLSKEVSVNLTKLPDKDDNPVKEDNLLPEKKPTPKKRGRKKLQKNQNLEIISVKEDNHQQQGGCDVVDSKVSETQNRTTRSTVVSETNNIESVKKTQKVVKVQNSENSDGKLINLPNDHGIDETSISSNNLKSQDGSETDTLDGSKKQRKRRKNELAAIVADQLLESFKEVDKSKLSDLKKLENLAYEKSEDLLLTGMRLTPTTKRKIVSSSSTAEPKDNITSVTAATAKTENKGPKRKSGELQNKNRRTTRSKSQPNQKTGSIVVYSSNESKIVETPSIPVEKDIPNPAQSETILKKRKYSPEGNPLLSNFQENLFRSLSKSDEPLKLNVEPLSQKHNFRICSNFNTTQFEIFSTFKSSFDTFRSQTDYSFMQGKDIIRKSNFMPGSTETSNSVDSQSLRQEDVSATTTKPCENGPSDKSKSTFLKKLKKKLNRKKDKKIDNENINELRTGLELISFEKDLNNQSVGSKLGNNKSLNYFDAALESTSAIVTRSQISLSNVDLSSNKDDLQFLSEIKKPLLRPSILKATLEATAAAAAGALNSETSPQTDIITKSVSSRDPRLNKNKIPTNVEEEKNETIYLAPPFERRKMGSMRQRRKSESILRRNATFVTAEEQFDNLNTAFIHPRERLRSSSRRDKIAKQSLDVVVVNHDVKNQSKPEVENDGRTEEDEDNYLSQIAKSVNDKIMSSEDEGDGFEMYNTTDSILLLGATERPARPPTSMSLRSMPNFNDDQSNADFLQDDDNTNTELIDMDLEDDISVYTSFSQDISRFTRKGGKFHSKRRRRKSILLNRKPKKQNISDQPEEIFNCDICNKNFRKALALSKHQMTLTHIAKLSEREYIHASNVAKSKEEEEEKRKCESPCSFIESDIEEIVVKEKEDQPPTENSSKPIHPIEIIEIDDKDSEPAEELVNEGEAAAAMPVETEVPPEPIESVIVEKPQQQQQQPSSVINLLNQSGIEPISSPEQVESNYDRYQNVSSRIALSQEERLFYECCNMLKGSETPMVERTYPVVPYSAYDVPNKPVTPKSSERFSYLGSEVTGNFHHGTAYTVKSPMSQSRTSPRHAFPKIDVNQFSDISSDSNPAFPRAQIHSGIQPNVNYPIADLSNKTFPNYPPPPPPPPTPSHHQSPLREVQNTTQTGMVGSFGGQEITPHIFQEPYYSGEGRFTPTRFPAVIGIDGGGSAAASLTARTFVNENHVKDFGVGRETAGMAPYSNYIVQERNQGLPAIQNQNFTSPIHSTSSQGSTTTTTTICRMKTKAAMKGYDNFKVSIPTLGLDMQQALERSPHAAGCKLTALAEIALGSEVPITTLNRYPSVQIRDDIFDKPKIKPDINEKFAKKYQELIKSNMEPETEKSAKKKNNLDRTGNKLGFKAKKNKHRSTMKVCDISKSSEKEKDIYDFDDTEEMEPSEIIKSPVRARSTNTTAGGSKSTEEKIIIPERPFKNIGLDEQQSIKFHKPDDVNTQNEESILSSTSYSDRDDFNYGSMSDNEDGNQDDDDNDDGEASSDIESISSARTAKTIENKCLIVGRIFKKATKNRTVEDKKPECTVVEQKKKLPTQELNKLFDSLREEIKEQQQHQQQQQQDPIIETHPKIPINSEHIPNEPVVANTSTAATTGVPTLLGKPADDSFIDKSKEADQPKGKNYEKFCDKEKSSNAKQTKDLKKDDEKRQMGTEVKDKKEVKRRSRKDTSKQQQQQQQEQQQKSKEIYKLQSELGMSAEEIASLINEGKRKSQRRCAANRPQKFVETWSSDEYEDFLSTKDIIAFIEEKEKKIRKRKSTSRNNEKKKAPNDGGGGVGGNINNQKQEINNSSSNIVEKLKEKEELNELNTKGNSNTVESTNKKPEKFVDKLLEKITKAQKERQTNSNISNDKNETGTAVKSSQIKTESETTKIEIKDKKPPPPSSVVLSKTSGKSPLKKPTLSVKPRLKTTKNANDSESDFEMEWRRSRTKIKKRRKTISFKERENSGKRQSKPPADSSRRNSGGCHGVGPGRTTNATNASGGKGKVNNSPKDNNSGTKDNPKGKNNSSQNINENTKPLARRKRVASEMLYYWSSSSDEDFGRIEIETRDDDDDDDISPEGEHYQQHGWIVGDSHKKLVTLLAIAKGKKVEDCGVKEAGYKKKS